MVSRLTRYLDGDTRYSSMLGPLPSTVSFQLSEHRGTCPVQVRAPVAAKLFPAPAVLAASAALRRTP
ncbi:MAG: hypothetical protein QM733_20415 [Ilumatobacteraceae bacterium]